MATLTELLGQIDTGPVSLMQATVIAMGVGTCTIRFAPNTAPTATPGSSSNSFTRVETGSSSLDNVAGVRYLATASFVAGDTVLVLRTGNAFVVIGKTNATSGSRPEFYDGLELYHGSSTPYIDFHRAANPAGDSNADNNVRLINDANGVLTLGPATAHFNAGNGRVGTSIPHGSTYMEFANNFSTAAGDYALIQNNDGEVYLNASAGHNIHLRINNNSSDAMLVTSARSLHASFGVSGATLVEGLGTNQLVGGGVGNPNYIIQAGTVVINFVSGNGNFNWSWGFPGGVNGVVTCEAGGTSGWIIGNQNVSLTGTGVYAMHQSGVFANGLLRVNFVAFGY